MKDAKFKINKNIIIIVAISIVLIGIGIFIYYSRSSKVMIAKGIDDITSMVKKDVFMNSKQFDVGKDYTLNSDLTFNIESNYLQQLSAYSPEYQTYSKLISNLSKTKNKIVIKHDQTNKKAFVTLDTNYNGTDLLNLKYLIENNTEYYYIKGFMDSYINNGTSNYFESLDSNTTDSENLEYIYNFTLSSFKNNLKKEYFKRSSSKILIDEKEKNYQKITLSIDNKILKEIAKNILNDLKKDKKANKILVSINKDFTKAKINNSKKYLSDNQKIEFSVYNDYFYRIKKYDLNFISNNDNLLITYTKGNEGKLEVYKNNKIQGYLNIKKNDDETNIDIFDSDSKNIGNIVIKQTENTYSLTTNITIETLKISASINNNISKLIKNKSYNQDLKFNISATSNGSSLISINIGMKNKMKKGVSIKEDTSNVILANDVTQDKKDAFTNSIMTTLTTLMS